LEAEVTLQKTTNFTDNCTLHLSSLVLPNLYVSSDMRARDIPTPDTPEVDSDEDYNSALRTVVLPVLGSLALAAVLLAILYTIFKHFKQKWKAKKSQLSPAVPSTECTQSSAPA
jgi:hypothetical protein